MSDADYIPANEIDELANGWDEGVLIARSHAVVLEAAHELAEALRELAEALRELMANIDDYDVPEHFQWSYYELADSALNRFDALGGNNE
jgi:sugar phosphate isomerase/epimerase